MSAILRHRHANRFTILPNDAIRNPALSFRAVGVLAHLLSLPDGARVDSASLAAAHKEGRDAVRAAFSELGSHGYYRREVVRLPDGTLRTEVVVSSTPIEESAGHTGDGFPGVGSPEPENPAPVEPASVCPAPDFQAPREVTEEVTLYPPNPPAERGGEDGRSGGVGRRATGTNLRARHENPRAEAEAEQTQVDAVRHAAAIDAEVAARRREAEEAAAARAQAEAEAAGLSAALDDQLLHALLARCRDGLPGPLACSAAGLTRAAITWSRAAAAEFPGDLAIALRAALAEQWSGPEPGVHPSPLTLTPAPPETQPLIDRVRAWLDALRPTG